MSSPPVVTRVKVPPTIVVDASSRREVASPSMVLVVSAKFAKFASC